MRKHGRGSIIVRVCGFGYDEDDDIGDEDDDDDEDDEHDEDDGDLRAGDQGGRWAEER